MSTIAAKPATTPIPVQLSDSEFTAFIFPHLSMPKRGPKCKLGYHRVFNLILWLLYTGMQWKCLPVPTDSLGNRSFTTRPCTKSLRDGPMMGRSGSFHRQCAASSGREAPRYQCAAWRRTNTVAKKGRWIDYSGYKHQKGEKVIAIIDNNGSVLAPVPVAPVNTTDMILLPPRA